jgi:hypothetical protein
MVRCLAQQQQNFGRLTHPCIENSVTLLRPGKELLKQLNNKKESKRIRILPEFWQTVISSSEHLFAERDEIRWFGQVKVFVAPIFTTSSTTCLNFVYD